MGRRYLPTVFRAEAGAPPEAGKRPSACPDGAKVGAGAGAVNQPVGDFVVSIGSLIGVTSRPQMLGCAPDVLERPRGEERPRKPGASLGGAGLGSAVATFGKARRFDAATATASFGQTVGATASSASAPARAAACRNLLSTAASTHAG